MKQFTRRETVVLTRTSPARLAYLAKIGMITPTCLADDPQGQLYYSWDQILELRAIRQLRGEISLQMIRKIMQFLEGVGGDRTLHNKHLVIANGEVSWIQRESGQAPHVVRVAAKANRHVGQLKLTITPPVSELADEVWRIACQSKVVDFESFRQRTLHPRTE
ncbi:MAG: MerR family transcriptional regulator [Cyanobacteria bacterium J06626_18]